MFERGSAREFSARKNISSIGIITFHTYRDEVLPIWRFDKNIDILPPSYSNTLSLQYSPALKPSNQIL